ncbi:hypothetical protein ASJ79_21700 [Mycobacterium sp. NAZ190054]|nr:hypothetical protein ASJ79_21700 [Mycobacterium sp. NAZ190054]
MPMLSIQQVSKTFKSRGNKSNTATIALTDVNLDVEEGEFCAIIGASGCGKSTLLRIIDGLTAPSSGRVMLRGREVTEPGPDRAMVFQHAHLMPWRTVQKNVEFGLEPRDVRAGDRRQRAARYLNLVGLTGFEKHYPAQLSGGMQQRVGLARAFAVEPELLLLDEPFGALDAQTRLQLQTELSRIWSEAGRTAVLITHDIEEAVFLADRVVVMGSRPGRVIDVVDIPFERPRTDSVRMHPDFTVLKSRLWESLRDSMSESA